MKALHIIAFILLVIGGLNWGLIGIGGFVGANWNVIGLIFGSVPVVAWIIYILVGLSALLLIFKKMMKGNRSAGPAM